MASKKLGPKKFLSFEHKAFELFTADTKNCVEVTISLPTFVLFALGHEICQKIYTTRFPGQKFYTL